MKIKEFNGLVVGQGLRLDLGLWAEDLDLGVVDLGFAGFWELGFISKFVEF